MAKAIRQADYTISDGDAGIYETVNYMWNYALRDSVDPLVKSQVAKLRGKDAISTIKKIYDYVWRTVKYELDPPDRELITAPIHFINGNRSTGDCDCMTTLLVCLLESAGFESAITVVAWRVYDYTHVFAEVKYNNKWFILDPTLKEDGFGKQDKKIHRFKRVTKKEMGKLTVLADNGGGSMSSYIPPAKINSGDKNASSVSQNHQQKSSLGKRNRPCVDRHGRDCSCGCGGHNDNEDSNKNSNNITINFGTNVENSHNATDYDTSNDYNHSAYSENSSRNNMRNEERLYNDSSRRSVSNEHLPSLVSVPDSYHNSRNYGVERREPILLHPIVRNGRAYFRRDGDVDNSQNLVGNVRPPVINYDNGYPVVRYVRGRHSALDTSLKGNKRLLVSGSLAPKTRPLGKVGSSGYPEFP